MLEFKGLQKTTLIDFPGKVACTLFLPKCNFRCGFCYNSQLVLGKDTGSEIPEAKALEFLRERKGFLDGACISGGEPLLHKDLASFCKKVKGLGLLVKLDTNGSKPKMLEKLLDEKLLNYVAMDIKGSKKGYSKAAGVKVDLEAIEKSIGLIRESGLSYEFRMTAVPKLHSGKEILQVGKWLKGSKLFVLQEFNSKVPLLNPSLEGSKAFTSKELHYFAEKLKPFFQEVKVREL